jgi:hypothetical protein
MTAITSGRFGVVLYWTLISYPLWLIVPLIGIVIWTPTWLVPLLYYSSAFSR